MSPATKKKDKGTAQLPDQAAGSGQKTAGAAARRGSNKRPGANQRERQLKKKLEAVKEGAKESAKDPKAAVKSVKSVKKQVVQRIKKYIPGGDYVEDATIVVLGVCGVGWSLILLDGLEKRNIYRMIAIFLIWFFLALFVITVIFSPAFLVSEMIDWL
ncbi:hypothetical protein ACFL0Z_01135 [Patescibacteria group bacterium]